MRNTEVAENSSPAEPWSKPRATATTTPRLRAAPATAAAMFTAPPRATFPMDPPPGPRPPPASADPAARPRGRSPGPAVLARLIGRPGPGGRGHAEDGSAGTAARPSGARRRPRRVPPAGIRTRTAGHGGGAGGPAPDRRPPHPGQEGRPVARSPAGLRRPAPIRPPRTRT